MTSPVSSGPGVAVIVVAGGLGDRLGAATPKAFVPLRGEPLLVHAVRACRAARCAGALVVVVPADLVGTAEGLLAGADLEARVVAGGSTRQDSVRAGLDACPAEAGIVAVHDAARPLLRPSLLDAVVAALGEGWDAVAPAVAVSDTLKEVDRDGTVTATLDRTRIRAVQTPQVFRRAALAAAHAHHAGAAATDDLALVEADGGRVRLVDGDLANLKITYADDLRVAAALMDAVDV